MHGIRRGTLASAVTALAVLAAGGGAAGAQPATWNFQQADVPAAQPAGAYGHGVLVAVVDTWVDPGQPEFGGRVIDEADCLPGSCQDHRYAPDSCVHGTHVAGTIASRDYGVAPQADILAVQVLSGSPGAPDPSAGCSGSADTVATGIAFAVSKGARVINLSVGDAVPGVFQSSAISTAVANAAAHGVVVVFAAGNQGVPLTDSYGRDALLVAATGPGGQLAGYTNFDTPLTGAVDVAAPGGDSGNGTCSESTCILSTFPGQQLGLLEGTSMAAPHVSGLAALLLAQDPTRSVGGVFAAIENTARPLGGAGYGLIDAAAALRLEAGPHPVPASVPSAPASNRSSGGASTVGGTSPTRVFTTTGGPVSDATPVRAAPALTTVPPPASGQTPSPAVTTAGTPTSGGSGAGPVGLPAPRNPTGGDRASRSHAPALVVALILLLAVGAALGRLGRDRILRR